MDTYFKAFQGLDKTHHCLGTFIVAQLPNRQCEPKTSSRRQCGHMPDSDQNILGLSAIHPVAAISNPNVGESLDVECCSIFLSRPSNSRFQECQQSSLLTSPEPKTVTSSVTGGPNAPRPGKE